MSSISKQLLIRCVSIAIARQKKKEATFTLFLHSQGVFLVAPHFQLVFFLKLHQTNAEMQKPLKFFSSLLISERSYQPVCTKMPLDAAGQRYTHKNL